MSAQATALLATSLAWTWTLLGCQGKPPGKESPQVLKELRVGRLEGVAVSIEDRGAQAWDGCRGGHYFYLYRIKAGLHEGDPWLCCVPITALLDSSFHCGLQLPPQLQLPGFENAADAKIQTCNLHDPKSPQTLYIPACVPAPMIAPHGPGSPPTG